MWPSKGSCVLSRVLPNQGRLYLLTPGSGIVFAAEARRGQSSPLDLRSAFLHGSTAGASSYPRSTPNCLWWTGRV
eukprot:462273-Pyramimonas_sp.AAC.1